MKVTALAIVLTFCLIQSVSAVDHDIAPFSGNFNIYSNRPFINVTGTVANGGEGLFALNFTGIKGFPFNFHSTLKIVPDGPYQAHDPSPLNIYLYSGDICWNLNGPMWTLAAAAARIPNTAVFNSSSIVNGVKSDLWTFQILEAQIGVYLDAQKVPRRIVLGEVGQSLFSDSLVIDFYNVVVAKPDPSLFTAPTQKCLKSVPGNRGSILDQIHKRSVQIVEEATTADPSVPILANSFSSNYKVILPYISTFDEPAFHGKIIYDFVKKALYFSFRGGEYLPITFDGTIVLPAGSPLGYAYADNGECVQDDIFAFPFLIGQNLVQLPPGSQYVGTRTIKGVKVTGWRGNYFFGGTAWVDAAKNTLVAVESDFDLGDGMQAIYFDNTILNPDVSGLIKPTLQCRTKWVQ